MILSFNGSSPFLSLTLSLFSYESLIPDQFFLLIPFVLIFAGYLACFNLSSYATVEA
jgi:hypothetical protein